MFDKFSLCPNGGAFMMHESVAEYDPNAAAAEAMNPAIQTAENNMVNAVVAKTDYKPVEAFHMKIKEIFETKIRQVSNMAIQPEDPKEAIGNIDTLKDIATSVANKMRMLLIEYSALYRYLDTQRWCYEPIMPHLKYLMDNYNLIVGKGYAKCCAEIQDFPIDIWTIERSINLYLGVEGMCLPTQAFNINKLFSMTEWDKTNAILFTDSYDFISCVINDPDRLSRLMHHRHVEYSLDHMINNAVDYIKGSDVACVEGCNKEFVAGVINYLSVQLRCIMQRGYDLQCKLMDQSVSDYSYIGGEMRSLIAGTLNLFYIPAIYLTALVYRIDTNYEIRDSINSYINMLLVEMKKPIVTDEDPESGNHW